MDSDREAECVCVCVCVCVRSWIGKDIDKVDVLVNWGGKACSGEALTDGEWTGICKINFNSIYFTRVRASQVEQVVKNPLTNAGAARNVGPIPGSGRSPGEGNGSPLQHSCLGNSMDRGAWRVIVHWVSKSQT